MGGECSTWGGEDKYLQCFGVKPWRKETTQKAQAQMGDNIKTDATEIRWVWTGLIRLSIEPRVGLL